MNSPSALASGYRPRSGHRYRDDPEPAGQAASAAFDQPQTPGYNAAQYNQAWQQTPVHQVDYFHSADANNSGANNYPGANNYSTDAGSPSVNGAYAHNSHAENFWAANDAWPRQDSPQRDAWTQQDSWPDGGAWNEGDAWDDDSWTPQSWTPENNESWAEDQTWSDGPDEADAPAEQPTSHRTANPSMLAALSAAKRGGAHRVPTPPSSLKGRAAVVAVAAGAVVAAGQAAFAAPGQSTQSTQSVDYQADGQVQPVAAQSLMTDADMAPGSPESPQMLGAAAPANLGDFSDILKNGQKYAENLAAQESAKLRPLFHTFSTGTFTSGFGARWGVQHLGVDLAGPIGTPIYAVADGNVIDAGPASGFGMWVRLLHADGTVTVYGHVDTTTVSVGEHVLAGDQIATMGNRGFSTGPHCHFEVWLNGSDKIDPLPWLATRGISLGTQRD